jgi:hypothetical protein
MGDAAATLSQIEFLVDEIRTARQTGNGGAPTTFDLVQRAVALWDESEAGRDALVHGTTLAETTDTLPPINASGAATAVAAASAAVDDTDSLASLDAPVTRRRARIDPVMMRRVHRLNGAMRRLREVVADTLITDAVNEAREAVENPQVAPDGGTVALARPSAQRGPLGRIGRAARASRTMSVISNTGEEELGDPRLEASAEKLREALDIAHHRSIPASRRKQLTASALNGLCAVLRALGDLDGSEDAGTEALQIEIEMPLAATTGNTNTSEQPELAQQHLGPTSAAATRINLCATLSLKGRHKDAFTLASEASEILSEEVREIELVGHKRSSDRAAYVFFFFFFFFFLFFCFFFFFVFLLFFFVL